MTGSPAPLLGDLLGPLLAETHALIADAHRDGRRRILGIVGEPGAGKSTLAAALLAMLGPEQACLVPMDGFHLADAPLRRLGLLSRKGALATFDADGYVALLQRIAAARPGDRPIWAPGFERDLEQPLAGAIEVPSAVPLVITEGNYLLVEDEPWNAVPALLDRSWYVQPPQDRRLARLVARHEQFGKSPAAARAWALGPDEENARVVRSCIGRADRIVAGG